MTEHARDVRKVPAHGTRARYLHRTLKCRCPACTAANASYIARYRAHGPKWRPREWQQLELPGLTIGR